jgi:hypothetical protein
VPLLADKKEKIKELWPEVNAFRRHQLSCKLYRYVSDFSSNTFVDFKFKAIQKRILQRMTVVGWVL